MSPKFTKEFADGWSHFCKCIDFGRSTLDAEAIQFMNEMPSRIGRAIEQRDDLLATIKNALISLAIIAMPIQEGTLDVATNEDLLKIMAESFKVAIAKATP